MRHPREARNDTAVTVVLRRSALTTSPAHGLIRSLTLDSLGALLGFTKSLWL